MSDGITLTGADGITLTGADGVLISDVPPFRIDHFAGIVHPNGKPIYNQQQIINQIDGGAMIPGGNDKITFTFMTGNPTGWYNSPKYQALGVTEAFGFSEMSDAEKAVAREAMVLWDDLIAPSIIEMKGKGADITFANTTTGPAKAHAYYPGNGVKVQGDVWTADPSVNWTNAWLQYDGYGRTTLIHEIGHSLGLSHPGDYNSATTAPIPTPIRIRSPMPATPSTIRTPSSSQSCPISARRPPAPSR